MAATEVICVVTMPTPALRVREIVTLMQTVWGFLCVEPTIALMKWMTGLTPRMIAARGRRTDKARFAFD